MSKETAEWLNNQTLIGYTNERGTAWHYRAEMQGDEPNHYDGPIPVEDVRRRLFDWQALEGTVHITVETDDGIHVIEDETRKGIVRSDTSQVLGLFKSGYQPHQYDEWLISSVERILDADLAIGSAGLLRKGAQAWVQVEMKDTVETNGVAFRPFLTACTSFDGSLATTYMVGAQVVVCDNTLAAGISSAANKFKVKHSQHSLGRLNDAREALDIIHSVSDDFSREIEELTAQSITDAQFTQFVKSWTGLEGAEGKSETIAQRKSSELMGLWNNDPMVAPFAGTAFGVLSAVNTHTHHFGNIRGDASRAQRNMERVLKGGITKLDNEVIDHLQMVMA